MNINSKLSPNDLHPTVFSQSLAYLIPYSLPPILDSNLLCSIDQIYTFTKPIGGSSPDIDHENIPAVLPIGAPRMVLDDLIITPLPDGLQFMLSQLQQPLMNLLKDDVFLAQPSILSPDTLNPFWAVDQDDTLSLSSHSSSSSQQTDKPSSPCLSPVTSPTNFLYNHEPLFDGIEDQLLIYDTRKMTGNDDRILEEDEISSITSTLSTDEQLQSVHQSSTEDDLEWFKLFDSPKDDITCDTTSKDNHSSSGTPGNCCHHDHHSNCNHTTTGLKRKRSGTPNDLIDRIHTEYNENKLDSLFNVYPNADIKEKPTFQNEHTNINCPVENNTRVKRRKKTKATNFTRYKKYQKKQDTLFNASSPIHTPRKLATKSNLHTNTLTFTPCNNKKKSIDQNKESSKQCQLIEFITEVNDATVFQQLTQSGIDWCRYCGTTEGVNWRPGPWGKRTLCNKHGCDYKGYGLASRLPRLNLSAFSDERLVDRIRPVVQEFCIICQSPEDTDARQLIVCSGGCSRAYHQHCHTPMININPSIDPVLWFCSSLCKENRKRNKVVVELPRKHMPLMQLLPKFKKCININNL
ncbi:hypothetical protein BDB01DRAFT_847183 [Pilobolus umbonatus]|nr:hypothetical protein BDB01DRAFT_847183 [Pilobolus umbonatus]